MKRGTFRNGLLAALIAVLPAVGTSIASAQEAAASNAATLQAAAANPIGNLTSVPFQENVNFGVGQFGHMQNLLNVQPVVPLPTANGGSLVWRTIVPLISQPQLAPGVGNVFGIGDINPQFYYIAHASKVMFGYGPTFLIPSASNVSLGQGKFGLGPDLALVITNKSMLYGMLANNIWSVAGDSTRAEVNQFFVQPFVSLNLPKGVTLGSTSSITANWEVPPSRRWTVPLGASYTKLFLFGKQPVQIGGAAFYNVVRPPGGAQWTARFQVTPLFPRGGK